MAGATTPSPPLVARRFAVLTDAAGGVGRCGRERKKAKATDLEKTVAALADQLGSMEGVRAENATLQDKNLALVSQLRAREEELERMLREQAPPLPLP